MVIARCRCLSESRDGDTGQLNNVADGVIGISVNNVGVSTVDETTNLVVMEA